MPTLLAPVSLADRWGDPPMMLALSLGLMNMFREFSVLLNLKLYSTIGFIFCR